MKPRKLSFKEQRELEGMEAAIGAVETRVAEIEAQLNDPKFYAERGREVPGVLAELKRRQGRNHAPLRALAGAGQDWR